MRQIGAFLAVVVVLGAGTTGAALAAPNADSAACNAAKKRIAYDTAEIGKAQKNLDFPSKHGKSIDEVRKRQLELRITRLRADLAKANAIRQKACVELSSYDGTYSGQFPGTTITIAFTVKNGVVSGDLNNNPPLRNLNPKTGNVHVRAAFLDADCGTPLLHFDLAAGTATGKNVTCKLSGLSRKGDFVANKQG